MQPWIIPVGVALLTLILLCLWIGKPNTCEYEIFDVEVEEGDLDPNGKLWIETRSGTRMQVPLVICRGEGEVSQMFENETDYVASTQQNFHRIYHFFVKGTRLHGMISTPDEIMLTTPKMSDKQAA
jgi:hypothetical protein